MKQLACNSEGIATTIESFRRGGIIIFPTDTVYGIGCNPYNEESVDRIYQIKKREKTKLLPVLGYSKNDLEKIVDFDNIANKIIDKFWPGPLTLILPLNDSKLNKLSNYTNNLAVRIPNNNCTLSLLKECKLIIGTSANISGEPPIIDPQNHNNMISKCDIFLNGGVIKNSNESTIIKIDDERIRILRKGAISEKKIDEVI